MRVLLILLAVVVSVAGCGGGEEEKKSSGCADPVAVDRAKLADLPSGLDLSRTGTVTEVAKGGAGSTTATAVAESTVDETFEKFRGLVSGAGYKVVADENEGVEAEVFFSKGSADTGSAKLTEGPCAGQVTIRLTVTRKGT